MWGRLSLGMGFALVISGFPMITSFMSLLGITESRLPSIAFRFALVILVPTAMMLNAHRISPAHKGLAIALAVFWTAYVGRVVHDGWIEQSLAGYFSPLDVVVQMTMFVLVPMLVGLCALDDRANRTAMRATLSVVAITTAALLAQSDQIIASLAGKEAARFSLERLNAITIGNVGGVLLLLMFATGFGRGAFRRPLKLACCVLGALVAMTLMMTAASRGPVLAAAVALSMYWVMPLRPTRLVVGAALLGGGVAAVSRVQGLLFQQFDLDVTTRFVQAIDNDDVSIDTRKDEFAAGWQQFKESPLFGDALFERATNFYPHNFTIEALMTTGLVGGTAYLFLLGLMLWSCAKLLVRESGHEWLALLAVFYAVSSQTAGSHFQFGEPWMLMIAVITTTFALDRQDLRERSADHQRRRRRRRRVSPRAAARAPSRAQ